MHNLHFILIKADSAEDAASDAENLIVDWGNENNWRTVGGVAAEDGSDDIENHDDGGWGLTFLDEDKNVPKEGTYFSRAVAYLLSDIKEPLAKLPATLLELSDRLRSFDPQATGGFELWRISRDLQELSELMDSRSAHTCGAQIPELREWQFDQFGLTDMTGQSAGDRRYLVFLDMHS
jgi:hypothetical protein